MITNRTGRGEHNKRKVVHKLFRVGLTVTANEGLNWTESNKPEKAGKGIFTGALFVRPEEEIIQSSIKYRMGEGRSTNIQ